MAAGAATPAPDVTAPASPAVARATAVAAILAALLAFAAFLAGAFLDAPEAGAPARDVLAFYSDHRSGLLWSFALSVIAWCVLMPAVFVGIRELLGPGVRVAATVGLVGAVVEAAVIAVSLLLLGALTFRAPGVGFPAARTLNDAFLLAVATSAYPTVLCAGAFAVAIRRSGVLPPWTAWLAVLTAAMHALAGVSLSRSGAFSPTGTYAELAPVFMTVWLAGLGVAVWRLRVEEL